MERAPDLMAIGDVEQLTGTPITTLRYYEKRGLIDPPARVAGQRRYEPSVLMRVMLIRFCRIAGLTLDEIAVVIESQSGEAIRELAAARIEAIDVQIAELQLSRRMMDASLRCICAMVAECDCGALAPVIAELRDAVAKRVDPH